MDVNMIVEQAIQALGKADVKGDVVFKTSSTINLNQIEYKRIEFMHPQGRARVEESWKEGGRQMDQLIVFDGKRGWVRFNGATRECTEGELDTVREIIQRGLLQATRGLNNKKNKLALLPETVVDDEVCVGLRVESDTQGSTDFYYSKKSFFLRKTCGKKKLPDGRTLDATEIRYGYRKFSGLFFPKKSVVTIGDSIKLVQVIDKVELLPVADAKAAFNKP